MSWPDPLPRPYPPATHDGEAGEVSAWLRRTTGVDVTYDNGVTCEYLATGDRTKGRFGPYRWTFGEHESGPDPHVHRTISEQFSVLSGEVLLYDGASWVAARPGDFLYLPEGGVHGFRAASRWIPTSGRNSWHGTTPTGCDRGRSRRRKLSCRRDDPRVVDQSTLGLSTGLPSGCRQNRSSVLPRQVPTSASAGTRPLRTCRCSN